MARRRKPTVQVCRKHFDGACFVCGERDYSLLDAHRILPGAEGGKYHWQNVLTLCASCHRMVASGRLVVHGRHQTTLGKWVVHYTLDGLERWKLEGR